MYLNEKDKSNKFLIKFKLIMHFPLNLLIILNLMGQENTQVRCI